MTLSPLNSAFLKDLTPRPVELETIDGDDDFYRMSHAFETGPLRASIRLSGLLHPLILEAGEGRGPRVVSGFRRYLACRELGEKTVPALFASAPPEALYRVVLLENLSHRAFNPVEISLALNRLAQWLDREELVRSWLPLMGLAPSPRLLAMYLTVRDLGEEIREALVSGKLNISDVPALMKWPEQERQHVFRLFRELKMGTNIRREVALNLFEIEKRDGVPPSAFLAGEEVSRVIRHGELSVPQKAQAVRGIVRRCRYPTLTSLEAAFSAKIKALKLPPSISVHHPPFFEGEDYTCTFTFRSDREFQDSVGRLHDIRHEKILSEEDHR